jgi:hypothetical protein
MIRIICVAIIIGMLAIGSAALGALAYIAVLVLMGGFGS